MPVKCPKCGNAIEVTGSNVGGSVRCAYCGTSIRVVAAPPRDQHMAETGEQSLWRNPAVYISLVGIAAIVIVFLKVLSPHETPLPGPAGPQIVAATPKAEAPRQAPAQESTPSAMAQPPPGAVRRPASCSRNLAALDELERLATAPAQPPKPTETVRPGTAGPAAALTPEALFAKASPAVVRVVVRDEKFKEIGLGSGFFVSADGILVTNQHVVKGAKFATVLLSDGTTLFVDGLLVQEDASDIAILKVNGSKLPFLELAPEGPGPAVGARVYAIGNPNGLTNTFSEGVVSGLRMQGDVRHIQTNAAVSPGSSGGPLLDARGRVVGVTRFILADEDRVNQNLNFAVGALQVRILLALAQEPDRKPIALASAGGKALDKEGTGELEKAWVAIWKEEWKKAADILTRLRTCMKTLKPPV